MALRIIAGGMAATSCRIASFNCSIVPGRNSVRIFVEKKYKMGCLEGSGVPVLCIERTVPKG